MTRRILAVVVATAAVLAGHVEAQSRPDFSGKWTLVKTVPAGDILSDEGFTLVQNDKTLTIEGSAYRFEGSWDPRRGVLEQLRSASNTTKLPDLWRRTYVLDGSETPNALAPLTRPARGMSSGPEESVYTAAWVGPELVVVTHNLLKTMYADGRADERRRQTVRERYAMTPDGLLVVETLIVADPRPSERPQDPPANGQRYFKKAS